MNSFILWSHIREQSQSSFSVPSASDIEQHPVDHVLTLFTHAFLPFVNTPLVKSINQAIKQSLIGINQGVGVLKMREILFCELDICHLSKGGRTLMEEIDSVTRVNHELSAPDTSQFTDYHTAINTVILSGQRRRICDVRHIWPELEKHSVFFSRKSRLVLKIRWFVSNLLHAMGRTMRTLKQSHPSCQ